MMIDITDLHDVVDVLKKNGFKETSYWYYKLGLYLGLSEATIDSIEANHRGNVSRCLLECLKAWLRKKDGVESKGGPTWMILIDALRKLEEATVADRIENYIFIIKRDKLEKDGKLT